MIQPASLVPTALPSLRIVLGPEAGATCDAGVPVLAGEKVEQLFSGVQPAGRTDGLVLYRTGEWLVGAETMPLGTGLEATTRQLYTKIFQATRNLHLARIWNYVPAINEPGPDGLENYRIFCRARSLAFEQHHGPGFESMLPSASAVGARSDRLTVAFAASARPPRHVENPLQVSAYEYPGEYGPRAPSFARATIVPGAKHGTVFISGTAAIRGHATIAPEKLLPQLECTLENLQEISAACGLGPDLGRARGAARHFKVYLRHAADQPRVATVLQATLLAGSDSVSYLHADICRTELLVEIEATLRGVPGVG